MSDGDHWESGSDASDWDPLEPALHRHQFETLKSMLKGMGGHRRILDLGCGDGRMLVPLAAEGHWCTGVDHDDAAVSACQAQLDQSTSHHAAERTRLMNADFTHPTSLYFDETSFDAVLCLGHTWMTLHDPVVALETIRHIGTWLAPHGFFAIDDIPGELWPQLVDGNWLSGVSEDGASQLVWDRADSTFVLRYGPEVDADADEPKPGEQRHRLWTMGELRLLAASVDGLQLPVANTDGHLIIFERK